MSEENWLVAKKIDKAIDLVQDKLTVRQWLLFGVACCRAIPAKYADASSRTTLDHVERVADGGPPHPSLTATARPGFDVPMTAIDEALRDPETARHKYAANLAVRQLAARLVDWPCTADEVLEAVRAVSQTSRHNPDKSPKEQLALLRDIAGNPFRPRVIAGAWKSSDAVALATAIDAGRAFDRLPILADALQEAGCTEPEVLAHCRSAGPHVRGCWVIDRVLGKLK